MRRRALLARTALLTLPAGLAGCSGLTDDGTEPGTEPPAGSDQPTASPEPSPEPSPTPDAARGLGDLRVVEHSLERRNAGTDSELVAVDATVENAGDASLDVLAVAQFRDENGSLLGQSEAETDGLAPGGTWSVELLFGGSGEAARAVADYRLTADVR